MNKLLFIILEQYLLTFNQHNMFHNVKLQFRHIAEVLRQIAATLQHMWIGATFSGVAT